MDRGAWQATVHRVAESDTTEVTEQAHTCVFKVLKQKDTLPTKRFAHQCLENPMDGEAPGRLQSMGSLRVRHD